MLTPIDIQNHTLKTSVSGYNKKDTEEFLASILDSYETLFRENRTLKEKITSLSEGIQYYKQMENTLQKALILAEKTSTETQEAAKAQADSVIKDAQEKADSIIRDIKAEADNTKAEAEASVKEAEEKAAGIIKEAEIKAAQAVSEAEAKAAQVIKEAEIKAAGIKSKAQDELDGIRISSIKLVQDYEKYCGQARKLATAQLELLESESYKLHVPELNIDNKENSEITAGINQPDAESADNTDIPSSTDTTVTNTTDNTDIEESTNITENIENKEDTGRKETNGFSWNSDKSGYSATKEPETPFTFIDPE